MDKQLWPCGFWDFGIGLVFVANGPSRLLSFILFFFMSSCPGQPIHAKTMKFQKKKKNFFLA